MTKKVYLFVLCLLCASRLTAQSHSAEIGFETDDDSYLAQGDDKYYTAGTFLYYRQALEVAPGSHLANKVLGFELGQKLYTPQSGSINYLGFDDPKYIDRPFAAYLYVGSTLNLLGKDESNLKLSAQLGIVGPGALGKEIQSGIHKLFGLYQPSGWEYQIENDVELNLSAQYNRLLGRWDWADVTFTSYANLGNGFSGAGVGPMLRLGSFNQLFNSESTQSTATRATNVKPLHDHELFFYYQPQLNLVLYDATIQGSLFNKRSAGSTEKTLSPESFIFSNQLGLGYSGNRFVIDAAIVFHTKDVKEMVSQDRWGNVTFLYRFR